MLSKLHRLFLSVLVLFVVGIHADVSFLRTQQYDDDRRDLHPSDGMSTVTKVSQQGLVLNNNKKYGNKKECPVDKPHCCNWCCIRGSTVYYCDKDPCESDKIEIMDIERLE